MDIHEVVVTSDTETDPGVKSPGDIEFAVDYISKGYYGKAPETIHEKTAHLMRLIAGGHPFVDGNKRTALNTVELFYRLNGYHFDYGSEVEDMLEDIARNAENVDIGRIVAYLDAHAAKNT
ncbi:type II toxin-antitoxin system death-on-curing family toxin [Halocatena marina]|uniref:type II toxin-antitoxin system death-on-curing family toxin n=1 Tax=Halocatena marina TaxID=2934937 RepID=UPI0022250B4F|nr:type II toxin-antitoxin system death-on-curing family toxin [Halocatena marina]